MASRAPETRPHPPTTAVVQVADDGAATLYLGTELVEHTVGVDAAAVMRVLLDYAATLDTWVRVTTQMPDGTWTRHRLDPDGTITPIPRNSPPPRPASEGTTATSPETSHHVMWSSLRARIASRAPITVVFLLLAAALLAAAITVAAR